MRFNSVFIQAAFPIIKEAREFIKASQMPNGDSYIVQNIEYKSLSKEDKDLLQEWRENKISEDKLRLKIGENINRRKIIIKS